MTGVEKLIKKGGTPSEIAALLNSDDGGCTRQLVQYWLKKGYVTPKWVLTVNRHFGIPPHELNPTIYRKTVS
jgi:hypothetical protein